MVTDGGSTRPRQSRRKQARRRRLQLSFAIAGAAALVAVFAPAAPTGLSVVDAVYRGAYGFGVTMACAQSRRWTWPIVAGGALLGGPTDLWTIPAAIALALAAWAQADTRRRQPVGAVVGALSAQALLRLPALLVWGVPSLVAFLAPLPAVIVAVLVMRSRAQRRFLRAATGATGAVVAVVVLFGVGALLIRSDAGAGARQARLGLEMLRDGDEAAATQHFERSASAFRGANDTAGAWWMAPARAIPVVGQHLEATKVVTEEGGRIARTATQAAPAVSLDELTRDGGRIRVERLVDLQPLSAQVVETFEASDVALDALSEDWLTSPMTDAIATLEDEIDDALPDARLASQALDVAPEMLGADGVRRYLVLFGNPAEAREMGGFVASMALLTADDGVLDFEGLATPGQLESELAAANPSLTADITDSFRNAQPQRFIRNWTDTPDIDATTAVAAELYPQLASGSEIHGVLYADTKAVAALLELAGAVQLDDSGTRLTAENADDYLQRGQYLDVDFEAGDPNRKDELADAGGAAFERLLDDLPNPRRIADVLSPVVQGRRLLFSTVDEAPHDLLREVGLRPRLVPEAPQGVLDSLLVTHGNRRANKLDAYLERTIDYEADVADDGSISATVTVRLDNTAPETGLADYQTGSSRPDDGTPPTTNDITVSIYTLLDLADVRVDGESAPRSTSSAEPLTQISAPVAVPAGESVVVEFTLSGTLRGSECELRVSPNGSSSTDTAGMSIMRSGELHTVERQPLDRRIDTTC